MRKFRVQRTKEEGRPLGAVLPSSFVLALALACAAARAEENELYRVQGGRLTGVARCDGGAWRIGDQPIHLQDVLLLRFSEEPLPAQVTAGVFLRGGSFLTGTLEGLAGETATIQASALAQAVKVRREDLSGALFPLLAGVEEKGPAPGRYANILAALWTMHAPDDADMAQRRRPAPRPGRRNRVTYANNDSLDGRLLRLGTEKALIERRDGDMATPERALLRLVELQAAPPAEDSGTDQTSGLSPNFRGAEVCVRLKSGDVLRGRVERLDAEALTLATSFAGKLTVPRAGLSALYAAGGRGWLWLSSTKPAKSEHVPAFDAVFPARADLSCDGQIMLIGGVACDRGWGVHARSELVFAIETVPGRRFVALVGVDDETKGRGDAEARVLLDGKEVWKSGPLKPGAPPKEVSVPLETTRQLTLVADFGPDGDDSGDHVDWGWAAVVGP
jgi:hypothetical protein